MSTEQRTIGTYKGEPVVILETRKFRNRSTVAGPQPTRPDQYVIRLDDGRETVVNQDRVTNIRTEQHADDDSGSESLARRMVEHAARGQRDAERHAATRSNSDPSMSILLQPWYAREQATSAEQQGNLDDACYWFAYVGTSEKVDPGYTRKVVVPASGDVLD